MVHYRFEHRTKTEMHLKNCPAYNIQTQNLCAAENDHSFSLRRLENVTVAPFSKQMKLMHIMCALTVLNVIFAF